MAIDFDYAPRATPLDPDEAAGLLPSHIATHAQLNEWEMLNILQAEQWAFSRKHKNMFESGFVRRLHKRMFGDTWRWAGTFRSTEKNIGVDPVQIQPALHDLCEDVKTQLEFKHYVLDEIALRFSHRLVAIHPFANGNGRLSRTMADLLLVQHGVQKFSWGAGNRMTDSEIRQKYIDALRAADGRDYGPLLLFVRS